MKRERFDGIGERFVEIHVLRESVCIEKVIPRPSGPHGRERRRIELQNNFIAGRDDDEAIVSFSKAIEIDPTYASAYANLGSAYDQQGKIAEAVTAYSTALEFKIDNSLAAQTHFKLGRLLSRNGNKTEAVTHYREALRLRPDYPPAQQALRDILTEIGR